MKCPLSTSNLKTVSHGQAQKAAACTLPPATAVNASNFLFALAVHRVLDKVQSVPVGCQGLSLLG